MSKIQRAKKPHSIVNASKKWASNLFFKFKYFSFKKINFVTLSNIHSVTTAFPYSPKNILTICLLESEPKEHTLKLIMSLKFSLIYAFSFSSLL